MTSVRVAHLAVLAGCASLLLASPARAQETQAYILRADRETMVAILLPQSAYGQTLTTTVYVLYAADRRSDGQDGIAYEVRSAQSSCEPASFNWGYKALYRSEGQQVGEMIFYPVQGSVERLPGSLEETIFKIQCGEPVQLLGSGTPMVGDLLQLYRQDVAEGKL